MYSYHSVLVAAVFLTLDATSYDAAEGVPTVEVCVSGSVGTGDLNDIAGETFEVDLSLSDGTAIGMCTLVLILFYCDISIISIDVLNVLPLFTKVAVWTMNGLPHQQSSL